MKTVVSVCSARPNFVKLAAVHHAIESTCSGDVQHVIVHTGQHYDPLLSDIFFDQLKIPQPAFNLGVAGGGREETIEQTQSAFEEILPKIRPDCVLVYGDVNGAVGAARAAKGAGITLAHVEAGLRSFDPSMPEEHNRMEIDRLADLLFCTEPSGMEHLEQEGMRGEKYLVGNTMIDTLIRMQEAIASAEVPADLPDEFVIVTLHRPSNVDEEASLRRNIDFLNDLAADLPVVLPVHHRLKASLESFRLVEALSDNIHVLPPLGYVPFLHLVSKAAFVLTDSGGIQEEAAFLRKRCFTLRKNTERPITIDSGSNVLIDLEQEKDRLRVMQEAVNRVEPEVDVPALWDGKTGERIVRILSEQL